MLVASSKLVSLAKEIGENRTMMQNAADEESFDHWHCEYELARQRYDGELAKIKTINKAERQK